MAVSSSLGAMSEWPGFCIWCLWTWVQRQPRNPFLFFSSIWHTHSGLLEEETPPHTPSIRLPSSQWLPEDSLIMGLFMHAVFFHYHSVGTGVPAERALANTLIRAVFTSHFRVLCCCYWVACCHCTCILFTRAAGNNLQFTDSEERMGEGK